MTIVSLYNIYYEALQGVEAMEKVKNSSPKKLSADWLLVDRWPTVGRQSFTAFCENFLPTVDWLLAVCWLTVGRLLAACQ